LGAPGEGDLTVQRGSGDVSTARSTLPKHGRHDQQKEKRIMADDARNLAMTYFNSWKGKDFTTLRSVLADDASFRGPLGSADDAEACMQGLTGMAQIITDIVVHKTFVAGPDVLTWFDLHTSVAPPCPTANWSHIENGRIDRIRVTFDARALAAAIGR
jgi:SnoaL-like domain